MIEQKIKCMVCGENAYIYQADVEVDEMRYLCGERLDIWNATIKAKCFGCGTEYEISGNKKNIEKLVVKE